MANRVRACLSKIFAWGMSVDLVDNNPCLGIQKEQERSRERVLSIEELKELWRVFSEDTGSGGDVMKLRLITGQRRGELRGMRYDEIDADGWWTIPSDRSKNGKITPGVSERFGDKDHRPTTAGKLGTRRRKALPVCVPWKNEGHTDRRNRLQKRIIKRSTRS
jgi:integrase